ncbi:MAG: tyrosine-protein phosphatase [Bacteroidales bacterium]|nr:tyrosine-protein phosphatase [Bacteroidales bacterium]
MKKFVVLLAAAVLAACTIDEPFTGKPGEDTQLGQAQERTIVMSASSADPETKTTLDGVQVLWDQGDAFRVMSTGAGALDLRMELLSEAGHPFGEFTATTSDEGELDDSYVAVYPYSSMAGAENGAIKIEIPQKQEYVAGSFGHAANIMVGTVELSGEKYNANFSNVMGVLQLSLTGDCAVDNITISDRGGKSLWGNSTLPSADCLDGITSEEIEGGSSMVILDCKGVQLSSEPTTFHFVVPVGSFDEGFDVSVYAGDSYMDFGTSKANVISLNSIKKMPARSVSLTAIETFNIENNALKTYLDKGPYSKWGATTYFTGALATSAIDQDNPKYKTISWTGGSSATYHVGLTDVTKCQDVYMEREVTGTSHAFMNMIPGHIYAYQVKDGNEVKASGKFKAEGRVRMVTVEDTWNFRDLGGWTGLSNHQIEFGWVYRCGSLNGVWQLGTSDRDMNILADAKNYSPLSKTSEQQLKDMGIKGELDLRAIPDEETSTKTDKSHAYSLDMPHTGIADWVFKRIMTNNAMSNPMTYYSVVQDVAWIIDQVVNKNNPVAFHCKSGADRTGAVGFTILSLLGVSEGNIALEFEITNMSHEQKVVKGTSALRGKYTGSTLFVKSVPQEFYSTKGFMTYSSDKGKDRQEKAYYYLNQQFAAQGVAINASDLDRFIEKMLGMSAGEYQHPSWAAENGNTLESIYSKVQTNKIV